MINYSVLKGTSYGPTGPIGLGVWSPRGPHTTRDPDEAGGRRRERQRTECAVRGLSTCDLPPSQGSREGRADLAAEARDRAYESPPGRTASGGPGPPGARAAGLR